MDLQIFNRFSPSEHFEITLFGITLFEFFVDKGYFGWTLALTLIGVKFQLSWNLRKQNDQI